MDDQMAEQHPSDSEEEAARIWGPAGHTKRKPQSQKNRKESWNNLSDIDDGDEDV